MSGRMDSLRQQSDEMFAEMADLRAKIAEREAREAMAKGELSHGGRKLLEMTGAGQAALTFRETGESQGEPDRETVRLLNLTNVGKAAAERLDGGKA